MQHKTRWIQGGIASLLLFGPSTAEPAVIDASIAPVARAIARQSAGPDQIVESRDVERDPFPGLTYGNLDSEACLQALDDRKVPYERRRHARGVDTPVRLTGPLHGVIFAHHDEPDWETSARREILDCRLALALDDLAAYLAERGVTRVVHFGIYRGDVPLPKVGPPLHHVAGLAIDVAGFVMKDDTDLEVRRDFHPGERACDDTTPLKTETATELRGILCDVVKAKTFHQVLTPNHDAKHRDHFHLEVMRHTKWNMVD